MTKAQIEIILLGSRFETMNKYVDLSNDDGTISKGIAKAMQEYAERYHISKVKENELLHSVGERNLQEPPKAKYRCLLCGRDKFTRKSPHNCSGGFRKRKIKWELI